jgi:Flp pilus assembly protein TadG
LISARHRRTRNSESRGRWSFFPKLAERLSWREERAAQIVEFAVALPLLILFVVGIFDFSNAFTLKQKLTNVARDAARTAAAEPTSDLGSPTSPLPLSVSDAFYVIDNYLKANNINDCGVNVSSGTPTGGVLTWKFGVNATSSSPCGIAIFVNRGYYFPVPFLNQPPGPDCTVHPNAGPVQMVGTCISIQYTYPWRFGQVASLIGGNTVLPTVITAQAVSGNEF